MNKRIFVFWTLIILIYQVGFSAYLSKDCSEAEAVEEPSDYEYTPLVSVGNVTVYRHKTQRAFYVVRGVKAEQHYSTLPLNLKAFRHDHWYLYEALLNRELRYSSAAVKIEFESVWR